MFALDSTHWTEYVKRPFPTQKTHWAWRYSPIGLNYTTFTVVYNARDILRERTNIINELYTMPTREPERFRSLRLGVSRAARHMYYAAKDCYRKHKIKNCDAFDIFKSIVVARGLELNEVAQ